MARLADKKLSVTDTTILNFLLNCPTGLTTTECLKLFHTTELRHIVAKLRAHGYPILDRPEKPANAVKGTRPHKRYYIKGE